MRLAQSATWKDTAELVGVAAIVAALGFVLWNFGSLEKQQQDRNTRTERLRHSVITYVANDS